MSHNAFGIESVRQIEVLIKEVGGVERSEELGFIIKDEQGIMRLSDLGMGYLLFVKAAEINTLAAAFAAGWNCAFDSMEDKN